MTLVPINWDGSFLRCEAGSKRPFAFALRRLFVYATSRQFDLMLLYVVGGNVISTLQLSSSNQFPEIRRLHTC
jgi:hypothetical protein